MCARWHRGYAYIWLQIGLQMAVYLQPYLQPCNVHEVKGLCGYFGGGCRVADKNVNKDLTYPRYMIRVMDV